MPPIAASRAYSASLPSAPWQLAIVTRSETPRWVIGIPAAAGTAAIEETPGTISVAIPARLQRQRLLAAAAEDERVAALQPDDVEARPAVVDEQLVQRFLVEAVTGDHARVRRRLGDELGCDEAVVDEHVAGPDQLEPACGDQTGVARACSDEVHRHPSSSRTMPAK